MTNEVPPGGPGGIPRWTSSAKTGVGTAIDAQSRVWFTLSHGIVNEVYYPNIDQANIRDLGFLVTDGGSFFSEEKRDTKHEILPLAQGVPGYCLTNSCIRGRYRLAKTIITDPERDVLLQQVEFKPLQGQLGDYHLYALLAPHLNNEGYHNNGWIGDYKGIGMLFAQKQGLTIALACSVPFKAASCGYVGTSDGWQDLKNYQRMTWFYSHAPDGNIALTGEIDLEACQGQFVLALGFGSSPEEAGEQARSGLLQNFERVKRHYVQQWQSFQATCLDLGQPSKAGFDLYRVSTAVLKTHEAKRFAGGMIASLSIPWGNAKGDYDLGGYHLVWPRDLVESAGGLLAAGDVASARRTLFYLMCTQEPDGHWPQNMWLDGKPYWYGLQMDETALFIVLADKLRQIKALDDLNIWPTIRQAAAFLVQNGPATEQDRWEETAGYSPFTLASEVAALLAAADFADEAGEKPVARYLRETADLWNANIERWTYAQDTELARQTGVAGYYVRIAPPDVWKASSVADSFVSLKNRPPEKSRYPTGQIVSPDALALVRFGLRAADDPRIVNTIKVIDAALKTETQTGPVWHRYNQDGYGEHEDGRPFDGTGKGRGWPLLAGERAHYELAAGHRQEAERLLEVMTAQASSGGLLPEQVWDAPDLPEKNLCNGHPSHSARPLVWAHAEYIKLLRSLRDGRIFDMPTQPVQRYQQNKTGTPFAIWRFNHKAQQIPAGKQLRVETRAPATVHWSADGWQTVTDTPTLDSSLGIYYADLPTAKLAAGTKVVFTFCWPQVNHWEGTNYEVQVKEA
jgi:glucoamylase